MVININKAKIIIIVKDIIEYICNNFTPSSFPSLLMASFIFLDNIFTSLILFSFIVLTILLLFSSIFLFLLFFSSLFDFNEIKGYFSSFPILIISFCFFELIIIFSIL